MFMKVDFETRFKGMIMMIKAYSYDTSNHTTVYKGRRGTEVDGALLLKLPLEIRAKE